MRMNIIITGANFINKGAQTMLFITAYEIKKKYPDYDIYYTTEEIHDKNHVGLYEFKYLYRSAFIEAMLEKNGDVKGIRKLYNELYILAKIILKKNINKCSTISFAKNVLKSTRFIIDISGYALSSKFKKPIGNKRYLTIIGEAHKLGIPMLLMPQSFGPFDYEEDVRADLVRSIKKNLQYPELIFAREEGGYNLLTNEMGIINVKKSEDLVLQNRTFDIGLIANTAKLNTHVPEVLTSDNVAVIPNEKVLDHTASKEEYYEVYKKIVGHLLNIGKNVYLIWHSKEDFKICRNIIAMFSSDNIFLVEEELNFWQFEKYIEKFDYAVASRFHSIVHAYKHGIPCIGLGWAEKYQSLFSSCGQQEYVFDVENPERANCIEKAIDVMELTHAHESDIIKKNVERIQKYNCFDMLFEKMDQVLEREG